MRSTIRCNLCRYPCKDNKEGCNNFYPQEHLLGNPIHFKEDPTKHYAKHESTSRMCVVCKEYTNRSRIRWIRLSQGYYPFCLECGSRNDYITQKVPMG